MGFVKSLYNFRQHSKFNCKSKHLATLDWFIANSAHWKHWHKLRFFTLHKHLNVLKPRVNYALALHLWKSILAALVIATSEIVGYIQAPITITFVFNRLKKNDTRLIQTPSSSFSFNSSSNIKTSRIRCSNICVE